MEIRNTEDYILYKFPGDLFACYIKATQETCKIDKATFCFLLEDGFKIADEMKQLSHKKQ